MIAATSKYAIRALIQIFQCEGSEFVSIAQIAKDSRIPYPYLAKVIKQLVRAGLLIGRKGPGGGVKLSPQGRSASLYDICMAMNEPILVSSCLISKRNCNSQSPCAFHSGWSILKNDIVKFLGELKIAELGPPSGK